MALKKSISDREYNKFVEKESQHAVRTFDISAMPAEADAILATYPDAVTEVYTYLQGGVAGTVLRTVTVTYTDATKSAFSSIEYT